MPGNISTTIQTSPAYESKQKDSITKRYSSSSIKQPTGLDKMIYARTNVPIYPVHFIKINAGVHTICASIQIEYMESNLVCLNVIWFARLDSMELQNNARNHNETN